jgi:hypothetical protein
MLVRRNITLTACACIAPTRIRRALQLSLTYGDLFTLFVPLYSVWALGYKSFSCVLIKSEREATQTQFHLKIACMPKPRGDDVVCEICSRLKTHLINMGGC